MASSSSRMETVLTSTQHHQSSSNQEEEINIFLKIMRTVALTVKRSETIKDLKALLCEKYGFPENHQELFLGGDMLVDCQSLVDCGVQRDSTVHLVIQNTVWIKLFVKLPSSQCTIEIEAKAHDTIRNIKAMIQAKKMIPSDRFTLLYGGELLEEDSTLTSLGINNMSTLQMIYAPKDVLSVSVKSPSAKTVKLKVRALFTVNDVKNIVGNTLGVSVSYQNLIYAGNQLEDLKTLAFYDIRDEYVLEMSPRLFQIFVKVFDGRTLTIDVKQSDVVEDVKVKVFRKLEMSTKPYYYCRLLFGGKFLVNGRDLASYNIQKDSTLSLVLSTNVV
ncbi:unnamed protein product [Prunus armeniaca]